MQARANGESESIEQLIAEARALQAKSVTRFNDRRYPLSRVCDALDTQPVVLRNWLTREQLTLSADKDRLPGEWRRFSARDVVVFAAAIQLSRIGIPLDIYAPLAAEMGEITERLIAGTYAPAGRPLVIACWNPPRWEVRKAWGQEASALKKGLPPVYVTIDCLSLIEGALIPLGMSITWGNAKQLRAAAARGSK